MKDTCDVEIPATVTVRLRISCSKEGEFARVEEVKSILSKPSPREVEEALTQEERTELDQEVEEKLSED